MNSKHLLAAAILVPALTLSQVPMALARTTSHRVGSLTSSSQKSHKAHKAKSGKKAKSKGSAAKALRSFAGTISDLMPNGFTVNMGKKGSYQVEVTTDSQILGKKNKAITFADVKVGDKVRVKGKLDIKDKSIGAVVSVKDLGLSKKKKAKAGANASDPQAQDAQDAQEAQDQGIPDAGAFLLL